MTTTIPLSEDTRDIHSDVIQLRLAVTKTGFQNPKTLFLCHGR